MSDLTTPTTHPAEGNGNAPERKYLEGIVRWEDPPPPAMGPMRPGIYAEVVEELRANPGRWAVLWTDAKHASVADALRKRGCQVASRSNRTEPKTYTIYARYVGGSERPS